MHDLTRERREEMRREVEVYGVKVAKHMLTDAEYLSLLDAADERDRLREVAAKAIAIAQTVIADGLKEERAMKAITDAPL